MKVIIDRSKWRCGGGGGSRHGAGETKLLNDEGFMCCLGFVSQALGAGTADLLGEAEPGEAVKSAASSGQRQRLLATLSAGTCDLVNEAGGNTDLTIEAITINDDTQIGDAEREARLRQEFVRQGHDIEFQGEYAESTSPTSDPQ